MIWVGGFGWGPGTAGLVITLVMFAVNALGFYLAVRHLRRARERDGKSGGDFGIWIDKPPPSPSARRAGRDHEEALRILEERYARGEIDREEFLQRRQDLLEG